MIKYSTYHDAVGKKDYAFPKKLVVLELTFVSYGLGLLMNSFLIRTIEFDMQVVVVVISEKENSITVLLVVMEAPVVKITCCWVLVGSFALLASSLNLAGELDVLSPHLFNSFAVVLLGFFFKGIKHSGIIDAHVCNMQLFELRNELLKVFGVIFNILEV